MKRSAEGTTSVDYVQRFLARGEKIRRVTEEHSMGLVSRLARRGVQLIVLYVVARLAHNEVLAAMLAHNVLDELGIASFLRPIPDWIGVGTKLLAVLVILAAGLDALRWKATRYVVTDRRILGVRGVLTRVVVDTPLEQVIELAMRQTLLGVKFDYGDLMFRTAADHSGRPPMGRICDPFGFRQAIQRSRQQVVSERQADVATPTPV